ncbi:glycine cleavage system protein R [Flocculibacter collagenilyticus]|uniref:glycine cleavage system protein R n=1 Tax=Flocculibacter collagenilyticus TaxID=2744479 RepID=UPI0018F2B3BF|nr:ACT domain-containing protein [Flocculibacter collagenilyticus]
MIIQTNQQLVITAVGTDRSGIVNQLTSLVSECSCNILDSRMAIFGAEFTLIMFVAGDMSAVSRLESMIPALGVELELLTVTKRTSSQLMVKSGFRYEIEFSGKDKPGTLSAVTAFLAENSINIMALKSNTQNTISENESFSTTNIEINSQEDIAQSTIEDEFDALCDSLNVAGKITSL